MGIAIADVFVTVVQVIVIIELSMEFQSLSVFETNTLFIVVGALIFSSMALYLNFFPAKTFQYSTVLLRLMSNALMAVSHVHLATEEDADDATRLAKADIYKGTNIAYWPVLLISATVVGNASTIASLANDNDARTLKRTSRKFSKRSASARKKVRKDLGSTSSAARSRASAFRRARVAPSSP